MSRSPEPPDRSEAPRPKSARWPLGTLTALTALFVLLGVAIFGGDDSPATTSTTNPATFPTLGGTVTGNEAPDFGIELLDGTRFRLTEHLATDGRPVVLNLWASWCGPCRAEMPALDAASQAHPEVYFLGVAVDDRAASARQFAEEIAVSYDLAIDEDGSFGSRYPSPGLPATFFIDTNRQIVKVVYGEVTEELVAMFIDEVF